MRIETLLAPAAYLLFLIAPANANVVVEFEEVGGDVIARTTGSFLVPSVAPNSVDSSDDWLSATYALYSINGSYATWSGGDFVLSGLEEHFSFGVDSGDTFGYSDVMFFLPSGLTSGSYFTPNTTWKWEGTTLANLGLGYLTTTPTLVYTASEAAGGDTISFAVAIPEPATTSLLIGVGFLALARFRHRSRKE